MAIRSRYRIGALVQGTRVNMTTGAIIATKSYRASEQWTDDITSMGDNQPFEVRTISQSGGCLNGINSILPKVLWTNYPCTYMTAGSSSYSHASLPPRASTATLASSTLARTTPNRSSMEALVSLSELGEIPKLVQNELKERKRNLFRFVPPSVWRKLRRAAKINLLIQFGIIPMYKDIETMCQFSKLVDDRVEEIDRLKTRGLRRTVVLQTDSVTSTDGALQVHSDGAGIIARCTRTTTRTVKGHVRWHATGNYGKTDAEKRALAKSVVSGLRLDPTTLYEAMPWSWLIDYFTNLGDFVKINRNTIPCMHGNPRLMTHTRTEFSGHQTNTSNAIKMTPIRNTLDEKERIIQVAALAARMTFLTGRQTSILASLAVLRV